MKLVTFDAGDGPRAGVFEDERVLDAWAAVGEPHRGGLRELIAAGKIEELRGALGDLGAPSHPLATVRLLPPIPDPDKIVCVGLNYGRHAAEVGMEPPQSPTIFAKYRNALVPDGATVTLPAIAIAALSRSASAKTICGLLPPSSSVIGLTPVRATFSMMAEPARVEPVKETLAMSG